MEKRKKKIVWSDLIFYIAVLAIPVLAFIFDNFVINFNSLIMGFQKTNITTGELEWAGFSNFSELLDLLIGNAHLREALGRSFIAYFITLIVTTIIPPFLIYYVWKKYMFSEFFKVVLFLPSIVSGIITMTIYRFMANRLAPELIYNLFGKEIIGLTSNPDTSFGAVLTYSLWMSLGGGLLTTLGAMNSIDPSIIEAGKMDGTNTLTEFWHIILPGIYRVTFIGFVTGIVSILTADYGLYGFYGHAADPQTWTIGYYFNKATISASSEELPFYAAWGLMVSAVMVPITLFFRNLIYNHGPSED